jgi:hypothetical protein
MHKYSLYGAAAVRPGSVWIGARNLCPSPARTPPKTPPRLAAKAVVKAAAREEPQSFVNSHPRTHPAHRRRSARPQRNLDPSLYPGHLRVLRCPHRRGPQVHRLGKKNWESYGRLQGRLRRRLPALRFAPVPMAIRTRSRWCRPRTGGLLFEQNTWFIKISTDGRPHPKDNRSDWFGDAAVHGRTTS